jgi:hypothetical protein
MYTLEEANFIRPVNRLLNSPDPDDVDNFLQPYKVDPELMTQDDIADCEEAEAAFEALSDEQQSKIGGMPIQTTPEDAEDGQTYSEALEIAKQAVADLKDKAQKTVAAAEEQMALSADMTPEQAAAARETYEGLSDYEKTIVSDATNEFIAKAVSDDVEALPAKEAVTLDNEDAIVKARAAFNALTPAQKTVIGDEKLATLTAKLTDAETALSDIKEANKAAADAAIEAIEKAAASGSAEDVAAARKAYDALTDDQKKLVSDEQVKALTDAEKNVAEAAKAKITNVTVNVKTVNAKAVAAAIAKAGGDAKYVTTITLGTKVKKISASAFAKCPAAKTLVVKSKKLKKSSVKKSLKGSAVKTVKVPKKKLKAYKKIFTKKNAGKKVKVKK